MLARSLADMPSATRLGLLPLLAALAACSPHVDGNGVYARRTFDAGALAAFDRLAVDLPLDSEGVAVKASVYASVSPRWVEVSGDENVIEHVELQVVDGRLHAAIRPASYTVVHPLQLLIHAPGLSGVEAAAGALITVAGAGASSFTVTAADQAQVSLAGAGGAALVVDLSRGARLDAGGYPVDAAQVTLTGAAQATVWPVAPVSGSASGTGTEVRVKGGAGCAALTLESGATCGPL